MDWCFPNKCAARLRKGFGAVLILKGEMNVTNGEDAQLDLDMGLLAGTVNMPKLTGWHGSLKTERFQKEWPFFTNAIIPLVAIRRICFLAPRRIT
jgi:hypothetical protein